MRGMALIMVLIVLTLIVVLVITLMAIEKDHISSP